MTETPSYPTAETPFWRFSLNFYRRAGVADACITLQDGRGVDVNLLLFLFWLASDGRQLSTDEVRKLDDVARSWRTLTVVPIRDIRRRLKDAPTLVPPTRQELFRTKMKALELDAERLQQDALYALAQSGPPGAAAAPSAAAEANLAAYQHALGVTFPKPAADLLLGTFDAMVR